MTAGALVLAGCAAQPARGSIAVRPGRPGFVIAAPHATTDPGTGDIAAELARQTGFALVVATGFALEPDTSGAPGRRDQVNRPREGVPGRPSSQEIVTAEARAARTRWQELYTAILAEFPSDAVALPVSR